jgi:putative ABC transport system substrate-binding protein
LLPLATRIAIVQNPDNPSTPSILKAVEPVAGSLGFRLRILAAHSAEDINQVFATIRAWPADAVVALDDSAFIANRRELATQAIRHRLPLVCGLPELAETGCLVSYTASIVDAWYRLTAYVDKILKGARPADLPVEQASKFELVINLKTAKALDLTIPPSLLARADQVVE